LSEQALMDRSQYARSYILQLSSPRNLSYLRHHLLPPSLFIKDQKSSIVLPSNETPHILQCCVLSLHGTYKNHHLFLDLIHFLLTNTRPALTCHIAYLWLPLKFALFSSILHNINSSTTRSMSRQRVRIDVGCIFKSYPPYLE
jgi:hypothetical protein